MNPAELRSTLKAVNLTPHRAARLLGVNPRTVRRWLQEPGEPGYRPAPPMTVVILSLMDRMRLTADQVEAMVAASQATRITEPSRLRASGTSRAVADL